MNTVGIFAGRGDVIIAMMMAYCFGIWSGWMLKRLSDWARSKLSK